MTLTAIIVAALVTCVLGSISYIGEADLVPHYKEAVANVAEAKLTLLLLLPDVGSNSDNAKLEYLLLTSLVDEVSNQLLNNCELPTYDNETYYTALNLTLLRVENETQVLENELLQEVANVNANTSEVSLLVARLCGLDVKDRSCNNDVDDVVKKHPDKYQKQAELLLALGDLAELYLNNTYKELADNNTMPDFLLTDGLEELRPLIDNVTDVKKLLLNPCYY